VSEIANVECFEAWNGDSGERWADDADRRDRVLAPIAEVLSQASNLVPGERVVDIGCGCGTTTLDAARAVGPDGRVCGLDLSAPMLDVARRRLEASGLGNAEFVQGDAQTHAFTGVADVAISRFGTMFFADPVAAFANIGSALRSGGRGCFVTWQPLAANEWLTVPGAALLRYGTIPETVASGPGMFGQSDPDAVTAVLHAAGYRAVDLVPMTVPLVLGADALDATDYLARSGIGRAVLETVPDDRRDEAIDAVRALLEEHTGTAGVVLDGAIWVVNGERDR
jgi:ubiquinone/menaquinone biosynthesis C-methylase UbiE